MTATETPVRQLDSYVLGAWQRPPSDGDGQVVRDAATGEPIVSVAAGGIDLGAVVEYGRTVGQAALGALTFHQRALLLKRLAQHLTGVKDGLYEVSLRTGATRRDSTVDIDGGIGVLFTYGSKGRRELPNAQVLVDGPPENLSRDGSFGGQHVRLRRPGVAFQVNAFNFPVWGMLEKFAPAFLAGVPTIVKPASATAYLAEAAVRAIVEADLLPEGSLQLVSGPARGFLDFLDVRDAVGFTGSASTARVLAVDDAVIRRGVHLTAETDSLNAALLGPDAEPGSPEFTAFVASVVTEMTVKAGQKCTAIRRVIVPADRQDAVVDAVRERIAQRVVVGDPRAEGVTMGALASAAQKDEVLRSVRELVAGGGQ
ncbi:aldehyde dehydrogenase family protein, partial [Promicromonospora kroppenstedtii]|uniref:aldehyde dehydrogenase family protein n=1 Tax=Promicromonospora kroppenstedtii TaxID=440482 RepID=UPI000562E972